MTTYSDALRAAILAAAERYREAWQADRAAAEAYAAAYWAWRKADVPTKGPEHDAKEAARDVCRRTEDAHCDAERALVIAARGDL